MDYVTFPMKLYHLLEIFSSPNEDKLPVIGWHKHGKSFCIFNPKKFEEEVIPEYFYHTQISSFQRQLNLYGFHRISIAEEVRGSYYHPFFQRGRIDLLTDIHRNKIQSQKRYTYCDDSSSSYSKQDANNGQLPKKQKVSQYREYLNSFVADVTPSDDAITTLGKRFSKQSGTHYPISSFVNSNVIKIEHSITAYESNLLVNKSKKETDSSSFAHLCETLHSRQFDSTEKSEVVGLNNFSVSSHSLLESTSNSSVQDCSQTLYISNKNSNITNPKNSCYNEVGPLIITSKLPFVSVLPLTPRKNMNVRFPFLMNTNRSFQNFQTLSDSSSNSKLHIAKCDDEPNTITLSASLLQFVGGLEVRPLSSVCLNTDDHHLEKATSSNFDWEFFERHY